MVSKLNCLYEGKAKILYQTEDSEFLIQYFKDDATAFNAKKKGIIQDKGVINNKVSSRIFKFLESSGIDTHYVKILSDREMLVKKLDIIPVEVVVRNLTAGSLSKRMGVEDGRELDDAVLEYYYKNDELGDPMINRSHIRVFKLARDEEMNKIEEAALEINRLLISFFDSKNIRLVDFKLEFGRSKDKMFLADEITPDGCRLWDKETNKKLDKDRFRMDMGHIWDAYNEVYQRVCA